MRESLVGFCVLVHILALLDGCAEIVARVHDLAYEALFHGLLAALAGVIHEPAQSQSLATGGTDFDRHLIGGAADTASLDFELGHDVVHRLGESVKRLLAGLFLDDVKSIVNDLPVSYTHLDVYKRQVIVGRFVGKNALAAVGGSASQILNLIIGFFTGLCSGATVIIAQYYRANDDEDVSKGVQTAIVFAAVCGVIMTVVGIVTAPWLLRIMDTPEETMADSVSYMRIVYMAMIPAMIYNMGSAILRAVGDSKRPLYFLSLIHIYHPYPRQAGDNPRYR